MSRNIGWTGNTSLRSFPLESEQRERASLVKSWERIFQVEEPRNVPKSCKKLNVEKAGKNEVRGHRPEHPPEVLICILFACDWMLT